MVPYTFTFNITVTSGSQSSTKQFTLTVDPAITTDEDYKPGTVGGYIYGAEDFTFTQKLYRGSVGSEVMELQKYLNTSGYNAGVADGNFGLQTKAAVMQFQTANNLKVDGIVGAKVRKKLNEQ